MLEEVIQELLRFDYIYTYTPFTSVTHVLEATLSDMFPGYRNTVVIEIVTNLKRFREAYGAHWERAVSSALCPMIGKNTC